MTDLRQAAQQALEALRQFTYEANPAITALRAALEAQQEPAAWVRDVCRYISNTLETGTPNERTVARTIMHMLPLDSLAAPPARKPLSDMEIMEGAQEHGLNSYKDGAFYDGARFAEAKHGIGGGHES